MTMIDPLPTRGTMRSHDAFDVIAERIEAAHAPADERHAAACRESRMNERILHPDRRAEKPRPFADDRRQRGVAFDRSAARSLPGGRHQNAPDGCVCE